MDNTRCIKGPSRPEPQDTSPPQLEIPGGVYLCQVSETVSCGACCGLYNVANVSRASLSAMLAHRSVQFQKIPRTVAAIDDFAARMQAVEPQNRPFPQFHHCPFIGLIGKDRQRVGCLLHPLAEGNEGIDYRGLSYYGGLACRSYFCPAPHELPVRCKRVLQTVIDDWYIYGLIVTEAVLAGAIFGRIETMLGHALVPELFDPNPAARAALNELLRIKIDWPFRPAHADTPCHHFFPDAGYIKPAIDYETMGARPAPCDDILVELVSEFKSVDDLADARECIARAIQNVVAALASKI